MRDRKMQKRLPSGFPHQPSELYTDRHTQQIRGFRKRVDSGGGSADQAQFCKTGRSEAEVRPDSGMKPEFCANGTGQRKESPVRLETK